MPEQHDRSRHAPSYYAASALPQPPRPALQGAVQADVCVVGAGYTGLSTALHLAEAGLKVVVLEGALVGWGASGRTRWPCWPGGSTPMKAAARMA